MADGGLASNLAPGLADPVLDAQAHFRAVMMALARPGTVQRLAALPGPPDPLTPELAALALTLLDADTPVWLDGPLAASAEVAGYLRFHTGARLVADPAAAAFALVRDVAACPPLDAFAQGTEDDPDRSATLVLAVGRLEGGTPLRLAGPGIAGEAALAPSPLPAGFVAQRAANRARFPRGVDVLLVAGGGVAGLPRSTTVTEG